MIPRIIKLVFITLILSSCQNDKGAVPFQVTDQSLFELVLQTAGTGYYHNGDTLTPAGNSPHGNFRLRMNNVAQKVLNPAGELPSGAIFPDSSLLVKEIINSGPIQFAVMYKNKNTWAWAEFKRNGDAYYSVTSNRSACISCHKGYTNRDQVRTFDLH